MLFFTLEALDAIEGFAILLSCPLLLVLLLLLLLLRNQFLGLIGRTLARRMTRLMNDGTPHSRLLSFDRFTMINFLI